MPMVRSLISEMFGFEPQCRLNPDEVVALGAAIQGGLFEDNKALKDMAVTDIAPFTLGVEVSKEFGREFKPGYMLPIIHRNRKIPATQVKRVSTVYPNQKEISVKVYQGEGRKVEQCSFLGEFTVKDLPQGDEGQEIDIRFSYDLNGVLEVEATVVATGKKTQFVITSKTRGLTQKEIDESIERLHQLRPSPFDLERWKALLKRAECEYEAAPLRIRAKLESLIDLYEDAMLDGDKEQVERIAKLLEFFLENGFIAQDKLDDVLGGRNSVNDDDNDNIISDPIDAFDDDDDSDNDSDDDDEGFDIGNGGYDDGYSGDQDHGDDWKLR